MSDIEIAMEWAAEHKGRFAPALKGEIARLRAINAELRAMSDPKVRKWACEVWVLVDADGYIFATTVSYTRKDCLAIPHEEGVKCVRAVLTLKPPPRRKGDK